MKRSITFTLFLLICFGLNGIAQETQVMVRAKAKDAKFVGSSLGGAAVVIRNAQTGEILAKGRTEGTTGDTKGIMLTPQVRGEAISDEPTAGFLVVIELDEPTFVEVQAISPATHPGSQVVSSTELWLIPGKHILGDGIVLEIPGYIIDILGPRTHQYIPLNSVEDGIIDLKANIVMMCGCLIDRDGLWDSEDMEVRGLLKVDGERRADIPLSLISPNLFEGRIPVKSTGNYEITVYAYDARTGNTGVSTVNFVVH